VSLRYKSSTTAVYNHALSPGSSSNSILNVLPDAAIVSSKSVATHLPAFNSKFLSTLPTTNLSLEQSFIHVASNETSSRSMLLEAPLGFTIISAIAPSAPLSNIVLSDVPFSTSGVPFSTTETLALCLSAIPAGF
jgi:hypothetical protein